MAEKEVVLPVTGMTCASCALTIERTLGRIEGVKETKVNLASEKAVVSYDPGLVRGEGLVGSIRDAGYGVATARIDLPITGMTCANCVGNVERALKRVEGVVSAEVNLASERATVEYLPSVTSLKDLRRAVEDAGYGAILAGDDEKAEDVEARAREEEIRRQRRLLIVGLIFTVPTFLLSMGVDLGFLPENVAVQSATFGIHGARTDTGQTVYIHRITESWTETQPTWSSFANNYDTQVSASFIPLGGWAFTDITGLVSDWVDGTEENHGLMLISPGPAYDRYRSSEYGGNVVFRPWLEVCYIE